MKKIALLAAVLPIAGCDPVSRPVTVDGRTYFLGGTDCRTWVRLENGNVGCNGLTGVVERVPAPQAALITYRLAARGSQRP